jgi:predicted outer membrane protein
MVKTKKLMALAAVGALTLAACGSDDDTADTGT